MLGTSDSVQLRLKRKMLLITSHSRPFSGVETILGTAAECTYAQRSSIYFLEVIPSHLHLFLTQINEHNTIQRSLAAFKKSMSYYDSPGFNLVKRECTFPGRYCWNYELYYTEQPSKLMLCTQNIHAHGRTVKRPLVASKGFSWTWLTGLIMIRRKTCSCTSIKRFSTGEM